MGELSAAYRISRLCRSSVFSKKRITEAATEPAEPDIALPSWMIDEDADYVRPLPTQRIAFSGWWDLPIAATMWGADAQVLRA